MFGKGRQVDVIYLDFCKMFDMIPCDILISKLERNELEGLIVQWIRIWLDGCIQSCGHWLSVQVRVSGVSQGLVLSNTCGIVRPSALSADDTQLTGAVGTTEGRGGLQGDLGKLERWAHKNLTKFNKAKCKMLHLVWDNPRYEGSLGELTESSSVENVLGSL